MSSPEPKAMRLTQQPYHVPPLSPRPPSAEEDELDDDALYPPTRLPNSARRYQTTGNQQTQSVSRQGTQRMVRYQHMTIPPRRTATTTEDHPHRRQQATTEEPALPRRAKRQRWHWLVYVGLAFLVMVLGWMLLTSIANWWQVFQDDLHYGRPRTYQTDAVVGHNDSTEHPSHFIAENLHGHILIIELPGGDPSKARIFTGPTLLEPGADLIPVTLAFQDVNGDGLLDMVVTVGGSHFVFINDAGTFRSPKQGE